MTGHQINSLVGDLVAMAQAMERLPQVEAELHNAYTTIETNAKLMQEVRMDLEQSRSYAATLEQKVRDAEVAKDAAETMFLELDERAIKIAVVLDTIASSAMGAFDILSPKPEPVKATPEPMGQSEPDPTLHTEHSSMNTGGANTGEASVLPTEASTSSWATPSPQPDTPPQPLLFEGVNYIDVKGWVSREDWLAGGGTNESYDFRY